MTSRASILVASSMKYAIVTFGCRVNQADSTDIERQLRAQGGQRVDTDQAEVVVVNTCSVTSSADQGARQVIRRIARQNPNARMWRPGVMPPAPNRI